MSVICDTCKFKLRYNRFVGFGGGGFYCDVVCRQPSVDYKIPIPEQCKHCVSKFHAVYGDQKILEIL